MPEIIGTIRRWYVLVTLLEAERACLTVCPDCARKLTKSLGEMVIGVLPAPMITQVECDECGTQNPEELVG